MTLLALILIALPVSILAILIWVYTDYRKYKKQNNLIILLLLSFPTILSAQYIDKGCRVSFKWYENRNGKLECAKDGLTYQFIPSSTQWKIIVKNTNTEDARINWANAQLILNGRASEINYGSLPSEPSLSSIVKSQTTMEQTIAALKTGKGPLKIYDYRSIKKGHKSAVTIILPITIGKQPQFFNTFDFSISEAY